MNMDTPELGAVAVITALFMWGPTFGARRAGYVGRGGAMGAAVAAIAALCVATILLGGNADELGEVAAVSGAVALAMMFFTRHRRPVMAKLADEVPTEATAEPAFAGQTQAQQQQGQQQQQWQHQWHHHRKHWSCAHQRHPQHAHHAAGRRRGAWHLALWVAVIGGVVWFVHERRHGQHQVTVLADRFDTIKDHASLRYRLRDAQTDRPSELIPSTLEIRFDQDRLIANGCDANDAAAATLALLRALDAEDASTASAPPSVGELQRIVVEKKDGRVTLGDIARVVRYRNSAREAAKDSVIRIRFANDGPDGPALEEIAASLENQSGFAELGWSVHVDDSWIWLERDFNAEFPGVFTEIPLDREQPEKSETNVKVDSPKPADEQKVPVVAATPAPPVPPETPAPPAPVSKPGVASAAEPPALPTTPVPPNPPALPAEPVTSSDADPIGSLLERLVDAALHRARSVIDDSTDTSEVSTDETVEEVKATNDDGNEKQRPDADRHVARVETVEAEKQTIEVAEDEVTEQTASPTARTAQAAPREAADHTPDAETEHVAASHSGGSAPDDSGSIKLPPAKPKPDWVGSAPRFVDAVWYEVGSTSPLLHEQCTRAMSLLVEQMTRNYAADYLGSDAREIEVPVAYAYKNFVKDSWIGPWESPPTGIPLEGSETTIGENLYQCHILMAFDDRARNDLTEQWHNQQVRGRLGLVGIMAGSVLALLGTVFGYLKVDTATRGFYSGRLKLAAATVAAGIVTLAVLMANSGMRF